MIFRGRPSFGDDCDGFDFDQPIGTDQGRDADERAGWWMLGRDVTAADFADDRDVLRFESHDEEAGLHDVTKRRSGGGQREFDVVKRLLGLSFEVAAANDFARTFEVLKSLPCDIFLGAHGEYYGMIAKHERLKGADKNPFIDPQGYRDYVELKVKAFRKTLSEQMEKKSNP